jgi:serine/threonine-protein kinase
LHDWTGVRWKAPFILAGWLAVQPASAATWVRRGELVYKRQPVAVGYYGTLHQGFHVPTRKRVAVKVFHQQNERAGEADREFDNLGHVLGLDLFPSLRHRERFVDDTTLQGAVALDWFDGRNLAGWRPDTVGKAVRVTIQILRGLAQLHDSGLIHTDVSLRNILINHELQSASVRLRDLGGLVALRELAPGRRGYDGPVYAGTPEFMPPEQYAHWTTGASVLDQRTDLYSAAGVCVALMTGSPPAQGGGLTDQLGREISDPSLRAVLIKALAADPADRFQSAQELIEALQPFARL